MKKRNDSVDKKDLWKSACILFPGRTIKQIIDDFNYLENLQKQLRLGKMPKTKEELEKTQKEIEMRQKRIIINTMMVFYSLLLSAKAVEGMIELAEHFNIAKKTFANILKQVLGKEAENLDFDNLEAIKKIIEKIARTSFNKQKNSMIIKKIRDLLFFLSGVPLTKSAEAASFSIPKNGKFPQYTKTLVDDTTIRRINKTCQFLSEYRERLKNAIRKKYSL